MDRLTQSQMDAIVPHQDWDDGRIGCDWCRLDAMLDKDLFIRAELTWDNNEEDDTYYKPCLKLETNRLEDNKRCPDLITIDYLCIDLSIEESISIAQSDPKDLLVRYANEIADLKKHNQ